MTAPRGPRNSPAGAAVFANALFPQGAAMRSAHAPRSAPIRTLIAISALLCLTGVELRAQELPLERIQLPPGFQIEVYAHVPEARSLALGDRGTVFVGTRGDSVYAIAAAEGGKREVTQIARGLNVPNGV